MSADEDLARYSGYIAYEMTKRMTIDLQTARTLVDAAVAAGLQMIPTHEPKIEFKPVLQDWVLRMSLRQQGVVILALRGPDGVRKEDPAKPIVRTLRALVMVTGRHGVAMAPGVIWRDDQFMSTLYINDDDSWGATVNAFADNWDSYNVHFLQHLRHAFAVVGIHYPHEPYRKRCWDFYTWSTEKTHDHPETKEEIMHRLRDGARKEAGERDE